MATYSTATAVEPSALTALFNDREDADSAYEWLLKNGYNSSDVHLLMSEETRQKYHYAEATEPETTEEHGASAGENLFIIDKRSSGDFRRFHFPFPILDLSFVIAGTVWRAAMSNGECNMANGK